MKNLWRKYREFRVFRELKRRLKALKYRRYNDEDILSEKQLAGLDALIAEGGAIARDDVAAAKRFVENCGGRLDRVIPPPDRRALREWLDILLVAGAVAFGIRGLFLQPFRIPTSSMQPTLYGIHFVERGTPFHPTLGKFSAAGDLLLGGAKRAKLEVRGGGAFDPYSPRERSGFFLDRTDFVLGGEEYSLPGAADKVAEYSGLRAGAFYPGGTKLCDGYLSVGDHLFVERLSLYLKPPERGEVLVFNTEGLKIGDRELAKESGAYYIKRLAGLPGDTLRITKETGLEVRPKGEKIFRHITSFNPAVKKLYSGLGGYQKHAPFTRGGRSGPYLGRYGEEYTVPEGHYFFLGDNVAFSSDCRFFGSVPKRNLVGRAWLVFWPFSRRFGAADRAEPPEVPTGKAGMLTFPSMYMQ